MTIIIPHQLPLAPPPVPPPVFSGPLPNPQRSAFLFLSVRFFVSSNLLSCSLRSASSFSSVCFSVSFVSLACSFCSVFLFPLFRFFVFFGALLPFFRTPLLFSSARFSVSFGLLLCFLRFACLFLLVWFYEALPRIQLLSHHVLSPPLSGIFAPLKSDTRLSVLETMPFNVREHALLAPRTRPSTFKNMPFSSRLCMCLISCQLWIVFCFMLPSQRRDFRVCSC